MEAATEQAVSSFAKSLFLGEIHEELVFPFPKPDPEEQDLIRSLIASLREMPYDAKKVEEDRWLGDDLIAEMGERGLLGLYVPEEYGGQGLSQTGYCRVSAVFAQIDATLSVVMGVHQSVGMKGIVLICDTFCRRAAARVSLALDQVERNDDERMVAIAKLAYKRGEYGYAFFED